MNRVILDELLLIGRNCFITLINIIPGVPVGEGGEGEEEGEGGAGQVT